MGIKSMIKRAGGRAADTVARLAVLSPEQLREMQVRRDEYLSQVPSMDDQAAEELTKRLLAASSIEIYNEYLQHLHDMYIPIQKETEYGRSFSTAHNIRFFNITKWVTDKRENSLEKLVNVYQVLSNGACNIALVFNRTCEGTNVYLAVVNTDNADDNVDVDSYRCRLAEAIRGNFPGSEWTDQNGTGVLPCIKNSLPYSVACASNVPGEKSEKFISQTIEKLLDGVIPDSRAKEYTIILLATPILDVEERKLHLAELYSALAPYAGWQTQFTYTESSGTNSAATFGLNAGVSAGIQQGQNSSVTNTSGVTDSTGSSESDTSGSSTTESTGQSESLSNSKTESHSESESQGDSNASTVSHNMSHGTGTNKSHTEGKSSSDALGTSTDAHWNFIFQAGGGFDYHHTWGKNESDTSGRTVSDTRTEGRSTTSTSSKTNTTAQSLAEMTGKAATSSTGKAVANSVGKTITNTLGHAVSKSVATAQGIYKGINYGANFGANFARSSNVTATVGKNETIMQSFSNFNIKHTVAIQ